MDLLGAALLPLRHSLSVPLGVFAPPFSFSSSLSEAGDTSECRLSSGLRGGASEIPLPGPSVVVDPSLASEWRRTSASRMGTSSMESVESCGMQTRDAIFLRHTLHRQVVWGGGLEKWRSGSVIHKFSCLSALPASLSLLTASSCSSSLL